MICLRIYLFFFVQVAFDHCVYVVFFLSMYVSRIVADIIDLYRSEIVDTRRRSDEIIQHAIAVTETNKNQQNTIVEQFFNIRQYEVQQQEMLEQIIELKRQLAAEKKKTTTFITENNALKTTLSKIGKKSFNRIT